MSEWQTTSPKELIAALRAGGFVVGKSGLFPDRLRLHKTDITSDLRKLPDDHNVIWMVVGDPNATGRHALKRRTILIWLGK